MDLLPSRCYLFPESNSPGPDTSLYVCASLVPLNLTAPEPASPARRDHRRSSFEFMLRCYFRNAIRRRYNAPPFQRAGNTCISTCLSKLLGVLEFRPWGGTTSFQATPMSLCASLLAAVSCPLSHVMMHRYYGDQSSNGYWRTHELGRLIFGSNARINWGQSDPHLILNGESRLQYIYSSFGTMSLFTCYIQRDSLSTK